MNLNISIKLILDYLSFEIIEFSLNIELNNKQYLYLRTYLLIPIFNFFENQPRANIV